MLALSNEIPNSLTAVAPSSLGKELVSATAAPLINESEFKYAHDLCEIIESHRIEVESELEEEDFQITNAQWETVERVYGEMARLAALIAVTNRLPRPNAALFSSFDGDVKAIIEFPGRARFTLTVSQSGEAKTAMTKAAKPLSPLSMQISPKLKEYWGAYTQIAKLSV